MVPRVSTAVPGSRGPAWGGWRPQQPAPPGASWLGSQPCGVRAAAHQPAPWHWARDASQPGEEAAWLAASSQCPSCQPGGRPGRAETPAPAWAPWPGHQDRATLLIPTPIRGPYGASPKQGLRVIVSPGGDPGGFVPIYSAQLFTIVEAAREAREFSSQIIIKRTTTTADV